MTSVMTVRPLGSVSLRMFRTSTVVMGFSNPILPCKIGSEMISLVGKNAADRRALMPGWGDPAYRGDQLYKAIYRQRTSELGTVPNLPIASRERLSGEYSASRPQIASRYQSTDGTVRYLLRLEDGKTVECVLMPEDEIGRASCRERV